MIYVFASFTPKPGEAETVQRIVQGMVAPTRAEPGNRAYDFFRSSGEPATLHIFEIYADQAGLEAHRASEHYRAYRSEIGAHLAEPIGVAVMRAIDVA